MSYGETFLDPNKLDENGKPILCWSGSTQDESLRSKVAGEVNKEGVFETKDPPEVVWVDTAFYKK